MVKKTISTLVLIAVLLQLGVYTNQSEAAKRTKLKKTKVILEVGDSYNIKLKNKKKKAVYSYKSIGKRVASVSKSGKVIGKKRGNMKVSVMQKLQKSKRKKIGTFRLTVRQKNPETHISSSGQTNKVSVSSTENPAANLTEAPTATPTVPPDGVPTATPTAEPTETPTQEPTATPVFSKESKRVIYDLNDENRVVQFDIEMEYSGTFAYYSATVLSLAFPGIDYPNDVIVTIYDKSYKVVYSRRLQENAEPGKKNSLIEIGAYNRFSGNLFGEHLNGIYTIRLELAGSSQKGAVYANMTEVIGDWFPEFRVDQKEITKETKRITGNVVNYPPDVKFVSLVESKTRAIVQTVPLIGEINYTGCRVDGEFSMDVDFSEWESGTKFYVEPFEGFGINWFTLQP